MESDIGWLACEGYSAFIYEKSDVIAQRFLAHLHLCFTCSGADDVARNSHYDSKEEIRQHRALFTSCMSSNEKRTYIYLRHTRPRRG